MSRRTALCIVALLAVVVSGRVGAQVPWRALVRPTSEAADRMRLAQLAGDTSALDAYLLRSPSLLLPRDSAGAEVRVHPLRPDVSVINNSAVPFGPNTGAMWAQRGTSWRVTSGAEISHGRFRAVIAPELWFTGNRDFDFTGPKGIFINPTIPETRWGNGYADIWYVQPYSADLPWRLGRRSTMQLWWGQSGAWYSFGAIEAGATTENMWWGPGLQNAIVMSDNAAGVPRLELRTAHPLRTRIGAFEARWFVGALSESQYFDTASVDDRRSLAGAAITWRPAAEPGLSLGVARTVFATADRYRQIPFRWFDVFANTGRPANHPASDSSLTPGGRDQLFSLFARWVVPQDGLEAYGEWARQEFPTSFKDFVVRPTHSHGYTIGLQYRTPVPATRPAYRLQFEITTLEPSAASRDEPEGVFYTSRRVIQGYTQSGKAIGAAIGPGSSSQWLALDRVWPHGDLGATFQRVRWDEGVRAMHTWPSYLGDCNQDVSIIPGLRGGHALAGGYVSASVQFATRYNYHFQNFNGCMGTSHVDVHNTTLSIGFSPLQW